MTHQRANPVVHIMAAKGKEPGQARVPRLSNVDQLEIMKMVKQGCVRVCVCWWGSPFFAPLLWMVTRLTIVRPVLSLRPLVQGWPPTHHLLLFPKFISSCEFECEAAVGTGSVLYLTLRWYTTCALL